MTGQAYSYVVLRYVHDPVADESVNVGVLVHAPASCFLHARTRTTFGRLRKLFPDLDGEAFKRALRGVEEGVDRLAKEAASTPLLPSSDAASLARTVLPDDDSGLRWSRVGTGLTLDPAATLDTLFLRFVARHDKLADRRRDDDDVWRFISQKLTAHDVADRFEEKTIRGGADEITLRHAWKNGRWHAVEPVSLDLADADGVKGKARRWLGHLSAVDGLEQQALVHLVVGRPADVDLAPAYRDALAILRKAPAAEVVEEDEAEAVVTRLADEIMAHEAGQDDPEPPSKALAASRT